MEALSTQKQPIFSSRALRRLIVPLIFEQLLAMTVGVADTIMLTSVGEAAVSGVALVDVVNNLVIQVLAALATGGAVVCAQYLGRQDGANARAAAKQLLYTIAGFALLVSALLLPFRRVLLPLIFGALDAPVLENAQIYILLTGLSFPFLAIYNACAAMFRATGNSRVSLLVSVLMNVINIGGNALLIFQCGWGTAGAGTATLLSRAAAAACMLLPVRNRSNPIWLSGLHKISFDWQMVRRILRIGIPSGLENGLFHFGKLSVQTLVAGLGTAAIAANAIVNSISGMLIVPGSAIGLSIITVFGQCMGAGDIAQAKSYLRRLTLLAYACMAVMNLPLPALSKPLIGLFHLTDEATALSVSALPLLGVMHALVWPMAFAFPNALRAAGDARFTMAVSIVSMWTLRVGLSYVFVLLFNMGLAGVYYAMYCDWLLRILCFVPRYLGGKWRRKSVLA